MCIPHLDSALSWVDLRLDETSGYFVLRCLHIGVVLLLNVKCCIQETHWTFFSSRISKWSQTDDLGWFLLYSISSLKMIDTQHSQIDIIWKSFWMHYKETGDYQPPIRKDRKVYRLKNKNRDREAGKTDTEEKRNALLEILFLLWNVGWHFQIN